MCGIVGIINRKGFVSESSLRSMMREINHRGPDDEGVYIDRNVGFGFKRLSIIDLSSNASQPMKSNDERYVIVFNGEIYNYQELKKDLLRQGFKFRSNSDSEVLMNCYIKYGKDCLNMLNGMFAFAIFDRLNKTILLARDRAGKKPLHYYCDNNRIIFASEIKSIISDKYAEKEISQKALLQYLTLGYIISPDSIFEKIKKIIPGHYLEINTEDQTSIFEQKSYWNVEFTEDKNAYPNIDGWAEEFYALFKNSIKLRLNSDVPLAVFLSGGLDSSTIAATLAESPANSVNAFTIGFDNEKYSEVETARRLVNKYPNIKHYVLHLNSQKMLENIDVIDSMDEPFADSSIIPTYWVSRLVKEAGYTVALSGDGGDELLAGYYSDKPFRLYDNWFKYTNSTIRNVLYKSARAFIDRESKYVEQLERIRLSKNELYWYTRSSAKLFKLQDLFIKRNISENMVYSSLYPGYPDIKKPMMQIFDDYDFKYRLSDGYLTKVDRASMLNSLEVRNPFLDYRIIELLSKLPGNYKLKGNVTKILLRYLIVKKNIVPAEILAQRKMGFSIPLRDWVHVKIKSVIDSTIYNSEVKSLLLPGAIESLHKKGPEYGMHNQYTELLWKLFILGRFTTKWKIRL